MHASPVTVDTLLDILRILFTNVSSSSQMYVVDFWSLLFHRHNLLTHHTPTTHLSGYIEAHHSVPKGTCRIIVKMMAYAFFIAWGSYPILWAIGPEGFKVISPYANTIAHTFCDILAKELWTFMGHQLRIKVSNCLSHGCNMQPRTLLFFSFQPLLKSLPCDFRFMSTF